MTSHRLQGKVAVVTGGSSGIGAAVAARFAADGACVVIGYNSGADAAHGLAAEIETAGGTCMVFKANVINTGEVSALMDRTAEVFGQIDVLASCARTPQFGSLSELTPEEVDYVFAVNTRGQLFAAQHAVRNMPHGGRVILTSSNYSQRTVFQNTLYSASKAAVEAMVRCLSIELGQQGITINAISPGVTEFDVATGGAVKYRPAGVNLSADEWLSLSHSLDRIPKPCEVAGAYAFLAGEDAAFINGRTIPIGSCIF